MRTAVILCYASGAIGASLRDSLKRTAYHTYDGAGAALPAMIQDDAVALILLTGTWREAAACAEELRDGGVDVRGLIAADGAALNLTIAAAAYALGTHGSGATMMGKAGAAGKQNPEQHPTQKSARTEAPKETASQEAVKPTSDPGGEAKPTMPASQATADAASQPTTPLAPTVAVAASEAKEPVSDKASA